MQELIDRLMAAGRSEQQAYKAIEVIADCSQDQFPFFAGAIDKLFDKYDNRPEDDFMP